MESDQPDASDVGARWLEAMRRGDFEAAWRETDRIELPRRVRESRGGFVRGPQHLTWDGTPFDGRDVLIRCEHGLGDTLQFMRYAPLVRERARSVTALVQPMLVPLFEGSAAYGEVRNGWTDAPPPRHDVAIEVMELAYAFRSTVETLPREVPYLPLEPLARVRERLPPMSGGTGVRVGLTWSASDWDTTRSVPLEALEPLGRVADVRFYSLQQGEAAKAWRDAPFTIDPYSQHTAPVEMAAAAMLDVDLVITIDSMVAHLAGALGRPVWVFLKHESDWRWIEGRDDSPWYPTMRLFRQPASGDWRGAVTAAAAALAKMRA